MNWSNFSRWLVFGLAVVAIFIIFGRNPETTKQSDAPVATSSTFSAAHYQYPDQTGKLIDVHRVMGQEPMVKTLTNRMTSKMTLFSDEDFFQIVDECVNEMGEPYTSEWRGYLNQTSISPDDPTRTFFLEVRPPDPQHLIVCAFVGLERGGLQISFASHYIHDWPQLHHAEKLMLISGMVHEMRHLKDYLNYADLLYTVSWSDMTKACTAEPGKQLSSEQVTTILTHGGQMVAKEMLGFNRQYIWITKMHPEMIPAIEANLDEGPRWKAWKSGNTKAFEEAVYNTYRSFIWAEIPEDTILQIEKAGKTSMLDWALKAYAKAEPDPVE